MIRSERAWPRIVAHADMDAFYAAIEQLDDPALRGRAVLVGPPSDRGVVLTASYEARTYGVGSAMPMAKARRLCPGAMIVPPRFDRYQEVSKTIMGVFDGFSPEVEAISLDEAFLDMTGSEQLFGDPEFIGRRLKEAVREATGGLTASVGLSATKYVAKVASACQKPDGLTVVPRMPKPGLRRFPWHGYGVSGPRLKRAFTRSGCKLLERWLTPTPSSCPQSLEGPAFTSMRSLRQKIPGRSSDGELLRALGQNARSRRIYAGRRR
jgi:hypothetical protein